MVKKLGACEVGMAVKQDRGDTSQRLYKLTNTKTSSPPSGWTKQHVNVRALEIRSTSTEHCKLILEDDTSNHFEEHRIRKSNELLNDKDIIEDFFDNEIGDN